MITQRLRVLNIRSQNPKGFGGCIFTGTLIDEKGNMQDARAYCVVRATNLVLGNTKVQAGQWWQITGEPNSSVVVVNGYKLTECQIEANNAALLLPSGEHIVTLIAENPDFRGIGLVKARKLWEVFGEDLYSILDRRDFAPLTQILTEESAQQVVLAWATYGNTRTLQWLQAKGFDLTIGRKVLAFFGAEAAEKIEADPYRLLSFCAKWKHVDALAREHFAVADDDPRRLQGAIEEVCYRIFSEGHTVAPTSVLRERLVSILGAPTKSFHWGSLIAGALSAGLQNGSYVIGDNDDLHPLGPYLMEDIVARAVANRLRFADPLLSPIEIDRLLERHELAESIILNEEQRLGVHTAALHGFALITGGAGVGKTTLLKALYLIFDAAQVRIFQIALAGRAAKRMQEATGRPASTIAGFLRNLNEDELAGPSVIVIDEASMVDIINMSRLCELSRHVRILLVGDPSQLMPVGPGLVLHELSAIPEIPKVELKLVKRHGSEIAAAALAVRDGIWPDLPEIDSAPIAFIPCAAGFNRAAGVNTLADAVLQLYGQSPESTQILSSRRNGIGGTRGINSLCQAKLTGSAKPLVSWNAELDSYTYSGFRLGDILLCTRNMWNWNLQNGSLGKLIEIEDEPRLLTSSEGTELGSALAWVEWDDGERRPVLEEMLDDLELGYAITVHKAQGSQWERVIVPITANRLLDRTLVYTALTRAQRQVILIGDAQAARKAAESLPRAHLRHVALGSVLFRLLAQEVATV